MRTRHVGLLLLALTGCIEEADEMGSEVEEDAGRAVDGAAAPDASDAGRGPGAGDGGAASDAGSGGRPDAGDGGRGPDAAPDAQVDAAPDADVDAAPDADVDAGPRGMCDHPRSQCQPGGCGEGECRPVPVEGAPCVCVTGRPDDRAVEVQQPDLSQCDDNNDCLERGGLPGTCTGFGRDATDAYCGGAPPPEANECHYDNCQTQADCVGERACVPPGAYGFISALCVNAECLVDADCDAGDGGQCRPFLTSCNVQGFFCTYAGDPCRSDADCPVDHLCQPREDGTRCEEIMPVP